MNTELERIIKDRQTFFGESHGRLIILLAKEIHRLENELKKKADKPATGGLRRDPFTLSKDNFK